MKGKGALEIVGNIVIDTENETWIDHLIIVHLFLEETKVGVLVLIQGNHLFLQNVIEKLHLIEEGNSHVLIQALPVVAEVGLLRTLMKKN